MESLCFNVLIIVSIMLDLYHMDQKNSFLKPVIMLLQVEKAHNADLHCVDWNPHDDNLILTGYALVLCFWNSCCFLDLPSLIVLSD